jgi:hypothetical protein
VAASHVFNPIAVAVRQVSKLSPAGREATLGPLRQALHAMVTGVGQLPHWQRLASAMNVAQAIERQGIVRGLYGHLHAAELALHAMHQRQADEPDEAAYPIPHLGEIEVLQTAIGLIEFQLMQLSRGELQAAQQRAINEVRGTGGTVLAEATA